MKIAITGGTGLVGYPVTKFLIGRGHDVTTLGRHALSGIPHIPWQLGDAAPDLAGYDRLVHAAFSHLPDKYRGGEGDDVDSFISQNLTGTLALWDAARRAQLHVVFLSSRAVYDGYPAGTLLREQMEPRPTTLYGEVKAKAEAAIADIGVSLRATGVFGPPVPKRNHKWCKLFERFRRGDCVEPRIGTEVHSADIARAVEVALDSSLKGSVLNASGFILDRRHLIDVYARIAQVSGPLPAGSDPSSVSVMDTSHLRNLGWSVSGPETLPDVIKSLIRTAA